MFEEMWRVEQVTNVYPIERAAGGFVIRRTQRGIEVLLIDDAYGHVTFPKGHLEPGETWEDAAVRETFEETGVQAHILSPLGRVEYMIEREGQPVRKQVRLFLLEVVDESKEPVHQQEEVKGAYFLPWAEAEKAHAEKGYENWQWVFHKAQALIEWHDGHWESNWRQVKASLPAHQLDAAWKSAAPVVDRIVGAVREELKAVAPDIYRAIPDVVPASLPKAVENATQALKNAIEHTLLKPEASAVDVLNLCHDAKRHEFKTVCVNPQHVPLAAQSLQGTAVIPCTVVGFPLGATDPDALAAETRAVVRQGARDVDMVIPVGAMKEDDIWTVYRHVKAVCDAAKETPGVSVKVILEAHFLSYDQLAKASLVSLAAGAQFVKTSTGFAPSGAKIADVALMAKIAGDSYGVKASGGIRTREDAINFLRFGATRIGTSSGVAIVRE
jgi:deoxyribose-phosphate aldolase